MSEVPYDLLVIGGGAAGFFGALAFAQRCPAARIIILEKGNTLLAKVRVSGGGRCNVTHACDDLTEFVRSYPRGSRALLGPLHRFQPDDTQRWFEQHGVALKTESDGRMFPVSDSSESVIQAFLNAAAHAGIQIRTRAPVTSLQKNDGLFSVVVNKSETISARAVLLASGGDRTSYALAQSLGHSLVPPVPSLFTLRVADSRLEGLAGVSVPDAVLTLPDRSLSQRGPLLITHWGLSGPAAIKLSAWAARYLAEHQYQARLQVNWIAGVSRETLWTTLQQVKVDFPKRRVETVPSTIMLPQRLWQQLARSVMPDQITWADVSRQQINQLAQELSAGEYQIHEKSTFKEEFVTAGGVSLDEVNFRTMESRTCPGFYLAGEVLDIDGVTGGYNFQNAWTTAWIAAQSIADAAEQREQKGSIREERPFDY